MKAENSSHISYTDVVYKWRPHWFAVLIAVHLTYGRKNNMNTTVKAVIFDVDGTLYDYKTHAVPPSAIKAINRLHARGILVFIASGRSLALLGDEIIQATRPDGYVLANGHEILDNNCSPILLDRLSRLQTSSVLKIATQNNINVMLKYHGFNCVYSGYEEMVGVFSQIGLSGDSFRLCLNKDYHKTELPIGITLKGSSDLKNVLSCCRKDLRVELFHNPCECDVFLKRVNKLTGIKKLLSLHKVQLSECVAFGDSGNDVDMLKSIGVGVAMGNACPQAKAAAKQICASSWDNGIYKCLSKLDVI